MTRTVKDHRQEVIDTVLNVMKDADLHVVDEGRDELVVLANADESEGYVLEIQHVIEHGIQIEVRRETWDRTQQVEASYWLADVPMALLELVLRGAIGIYATVKLDE